MRAILFRFPVDPATLAIYFVVNVIVTPDQDKSIQQVRDDTTMDAISARQFESKDVTQKIYNSIFDKPLIMNVMRGYVVEAIIAMVLEPDWKWCSGDYSSWDFERDDGKRLEVKQSAIKQSWEALPHTKPKPSFDIKARTGRYEKGTIFVKDPGRAANLYVFAYHGI